MIATGGLLRINARRQDSLRSKTQKAQTHKKKNKKKRRNEVVVVKGKLKLISVSGLVAALGILVLLLGLVMAALGYWPREGLFFSTQPQEGATMASVSSSGSSLATAEAQAGEEEEALEGHEDDYRGRGHGGSDDSFNQTETFNGTTHQLHQGFLEDFLDRYLYSDRLKVLGPLIMGIGIFLFICANAVLHENRDKKTKVINLCDIYSTVIDLHSLHKPGASTSHGASSSRGTSSSRGASSSHGASTSNPLNGLVNYVQSWSLESRSRPYPASLLGREEGGGVGDTVFSVYQEKSVALLSPFSHRLSLPYTSSPFLKEEVISSFTLPLRRPHAPCQRPSVRGDAEGDWGAGGEEGSSRGREEEMREEVCTPPALSSSLLPQGSCSYSNLHQEVPGGSQALLLSSCSLTPSRFSLSSLSHLLSSSSLPPPCRRRSLPIAPCYKLMQGEESFERRTSQGEVVTSYRKFSNQQLLLSSQVDCGRSHGSEEEQG